MTPGIPSAALLSLSLLVGCSREPPTVYVPGDGYRESIEVTTEHGSHAAVEVGEPLVLHVTRRTGPWVAVDRSTLEKDACFLVRPADPTEPEVADNVRWIADPNEGATFNLGLRPDHTRTVRFDRPGVFTLTAVSSSWCFEPFAGEPVTVEVGGSQ